MRLPLVALVILSITPLSAQQPVPPKKTDKTDSAVKPKVLATPTPAPPKKPGVFGRMFGPKATPTPTPAPTPQPVVKPKVRPRPKPKAAETPEAETPAEDTKPKAETNPPAEKPKPGENGKKPEAEPPKPATEDKAPDAEPPKPAVKLGKNGKPIKNAAKPVETPALDDATKYKNAHTTALADEQIKELKGKADSALTDDEAHRASVAYNKALFKKIRQLDPSIDAYVDKLEEAMTKRLNAEKHEQ